MRGFDCECGEYVEARDDATLLEQMKQHAHSAHPGEYDQPRLRSMIEQRAYDVRPDDQGATPLV